MFEEEDEPFQTLTHENPSVVRDSNPVTSTPCPNTPPHRNPSHPISPSPKPHDDDNDDGDGDGPGCNSVIDMHSYCDIFHTALSNTRRNIHN